MAQGDDPAGGVAVATALREGFDAPHAHALHLIGQDYSSRAVGLHHPIFDEVVIQRPWGEFDTEALKTQFAKFLDRNTWIISNIDLEGYWLARHFKGHPGILSPPSDAYESVAKPPQLVPLLEDLGQPRTIPMSAPPADLHAFLRAVGWSAWVKGPFHDALRVPGWEEFDALAARLWRYWPFEGAHLQAHVDGIHESIGFAAHRGRLLDAIWIVKNDMTAAGKTTAASRRDMGEADRKALADYVATLGWTGGGEIELVRSQDGRPWLIEINPRFPSWVAGAALLGINLPGVLLEAASGVAHRRGPRHEGFLRVQREIPTRPGYDLLPPLILNPDEPLDSAKVAFNIHEMAHHISETVGLPVPPRRIPERAHAPLPDLQDVPDGGDGATPRIHLLSTQFRRNLENAARGAAGGSPEIMIAYSVKTNPDRRVLEAVHKAGLGAEVIGIDELRHALVPATSRRNASSSPARERRMTSPRYANLSDGPIFADSLTELESLVRHAAGRPLGLRLRPAGFRITFRDPSRGAQGRRAAARPARR